MKKLTIIGWSLWLISSAATLILYKLKLQDYLGIAQASMWIFLVYANTCQILLNREQFNKGK
jgi:hypothetical protein